MPPTVVLQLDCYATYRGLITIAPTVVLILDCYATYRGLTT